MSKVHDLSGGPTRSQKEHRHGRNQTGPRRTWAERHADADVKKVLATSVPYGEQVAVGKFVWAVYENGVLLCLGRTAREARNNYYTASARLDAHKLQQQKNPCAD